MGSTPSNLSASRIAAILGLSKYKSPFVAWLEIMEENYPGFCEENGYTKPERIDPWLEPLNPKYAQLRWGLAFEDAICDLKGGIEDREKALVHPEYDFITCHLDGIKNGVNQENKTVFEMAFKMGWGEPGSDMIPKGYMVQTQVQMLLAKLDKTEVNALVFPKAPAEWEREGYKLYFDDNTKTFMVNTPNEDYILNYVWARELNHFGYFHEFKVNADPELQQEIVDRCVKFWNENVLKKTPPPINGYDDIKWLIASPEGEIEATPEMKSLWSEKCDIENEIDDMLERIKECKDNFAKLVQIEIESKKIKKGSEPRKMNIYAGALKLASISKPYPGLRVSKSMVDTAKEDDPELYEEMKKVSFLELLKDELELTDKQLEKINKNNSDFDNLFDRALSEKVEPEEYDKENNKLIAERAKILKSIKLTKLLSKDSIFKAMQKNKPEMFKFFYERGIVEDTTPKSSLRMTKNKED